MDRCPSKDSLRALLDQVTVPDDFLEHAEDCGRCAEHLAVREQSEAFLERFRNLRVDSSNGSSTTMLGEGVPQLEGYDSFELISRGGQGLVYRARQLNPERVVAVKMLRSGMFATEREVRRLEREAEIAASLSHPNIVTLYETRRLDDGSLALVMEYVDGTPIDAWVRENLPPAGSGIARQTRTGLLSLFLSVLDAVHYSHQHGVIHRDLKPSNILVDSEGQCRVLDFGLAKTLRTDDVTEVTRTGDFLGSIPYAAPEQLRGRIDEIDTRSDVYALGVILYRLLVGEYPHAVDSTVFDLVQAKLNHEPRRITQFDPKLGEEIAAITDRALRIQPDRRYGSVLEFQRDLTRYLNRQPVGAMQGQRWYRWQQTFKQRWKAAAVAIFAMAAVLATALWYQDVKQERRDRRRAELRSIDRALQEGSTIETGERIWDLVLDGDHHLADGHLVSAQGFSLPSDVYWRLWHHYQLSPCVFTARAPDGSTLSGLHVNPARDDEFLTVTFEGRVIRWQRPEESSEIWHHEVMHEFPGAEVAFAWAPDGDRYAITVRGKDTAKLFVGRSSNSDRLERLEVEMPGRDPNLAVDVLTFSDDNRWLAIHGAELRIVSLETLQSRAWQLPKSPARSFRGGQYEVVSGVASDFRRHVISVDEPGPTEVRVKEHANAMGRAEFNHDTYWIVARGELAQLWSSQRGHVCDFGGDVRNTLVAQGSIRGASHRLDESIGVWSLRSDGSVDLVNTFRPSNSQGRADYEFLSDGRYLVTFESKTVRVWEAFPSYALPIGNHLDTCFGVAFEPDGAGLATTSMDGRVAVSDVTTGAHSFDLAGSPEQPTEVAWSPQQLLAVSSHDPKASGASDIVVWNMVTREVERVLRGHSRYTAELHFDPQDGKRLFSCSNDGTVRIWDLDEPKGSEQVAMLDRGQPVKDLAFDPSGDIVFTCGGAIGTLGVWNHKTDEFRQVHLSDCRYVCRALASSPDGRTLAIGADDGSIHLVSRESVLSAPANTHIASEARLTTRRPIYALAYSPRIDQPMLAAGGGLDGRVYLLDPDSRDLVATLDAHRYGLVFSLEFSSDGNRLASCANRFARHRALLWDLRYFDRHIRQNAAHETTRRSLQGRTSRNAAEVARWSAE